MIVIVARFAWVYPATYLPRLLSKRPAQRATLAVLAHRLRRRLHRRARRGVAGRGLALPLALPAARPFPIAT